MEKKVVLFLLILLKTSYGRDVIRLTKNADGNASADVKRDAPPYSDNNYNYNYNSNSYPSCCSDPTSSCCVSSQAPTQQTLPPTCCQNLPGYVHVVKVTPTDGTCCAQETPACCQLSFPPSCCHEVALKLHETKVIPARLPSDFTLHIKVVPGNATTTAIPPTTGRASTIATAGPTSQNEFRQQALSEHNNRRSIHNAPRLQLNEALNKVAQDLADKMAAEKKAYHTPQNERPTVGENIAEKCKSDGGTFSGVQATDMWYGEIQHYDFSSPGYNEATAHFTQVVWKGTTSAGFGRAQFKKGEQTCFVAVGRYQPRGNVKGQFPQNVLKGSYDS